MISQSTNQAIQHLLGFYDPGFKQREIPERKKPNP